MRIHSQIVLLKYTDSINQSIAENFGWGFHLHERYEGMNHGDEMGDRQEDNFKQFRGMILYE